jgi:hypothetical protein
MKYFCGVIIFLILNNAYAQQPPYKNQFLPIPQRVEDLLSRMTLEEQAAQLLGFFPMIQLHSTKEEIISVFRIRQFFIMESAVFGRGVFAASPPFVNERNASTGFSAT